MYGKGRDGGAFCASNTFSLSFCRPSHRGHLGTVFFSNQPAHMDPPPSSSPPPAPTTSLPAPQRPTRRPPRIPRAPEKGGRSAAGAPSVALPALGGGGGVVAAGWEAVRAEEGAGEGEGDGDAEELSATLDEAMQLHPARLEGIGKGGAELMPRCTLFEEGAGAEVGGGEEAERVELAARVLEEKWAAGIAELEEELRRATERAEKAEKSLQQAREREETLQRSLTRSLAMEAALKRSLQETQRQAVLNALSLADTTQRKAYIDSMTKLDFHDILSRLPAPSSPLPSDKAFRRLSAQLMAQQHTFTTSPSAPPDDERLRLHSLGAALLNGLLGPTSALKIVQHEPHSVATTPDAYRGDESIPEFVALHPADLRALHYEDTWLLPLEMRPKGHEEEGIAQVAQHARRRGLYVNQVNPGDDHPCFGVFFDGFVVSFVVSVARAGKEGTMEQ
jgi:hypothetical protein